MILANFDLSFFTSIPGLLITGGVLLLLIALIIFIATGSKKENKGNINNASNENVKTPPIANNIEGNQQVSMTDQTQVVPNQIVDQPIPSVAVNQVVSEAQPPLTQIEPQVMVPPVVNEMPATSPAVMSPSIEEPVVMQPPLQDTVNKYEVKEPGLENSMNIVQPEESSQINNITEPTENMSVEQAPIVSIVTEETSNNSFENITPEIETTPQQVENVVEAKPIYGGVSPTVPKIDVTHEEHRPIYGGANPLENTQSISINNLPKEDTLGPVVPNIEPTTPVVEQTTQVIEQATPVVEQTTQVVEQATPVVEQTPQVVEQATPVVEQTTQVIEQAAPVVEQTTQVIEQATPVVEQTPQVVEQATPNVVPTIEENKKEVVESLF